jgi:hypothetical protein
MSRRARTGIARRVQLRIDPNAIKIFDQYTDTERSEIFNRALKTIHPKVPDAPDRVTLIRPRQVITETICRIAIDNRTIRLIFPEKLDEFRTLVKKFGYSWQTCWERSFKSEVDILDRAAEIGHELLLMGLCIQVDVEKVKNRIVGALFTAEVFKLIKSNQDGGVYSGWLTFAYPKDEEWYTEIMKITAAKYADGRIYVPPEHYLEVEDFAEINDFQFTPAAVEIVDRAKTIRAAAIEIVPRRKQPKKSKSKKQHEPSNSIPKHLRDD